jgi:hypothetical protein
MFNFFLKKKEIESKLISVVEYPDNYIFETFFKIETGLWKLTDIISISKKDISGSEITELILKHLSCSKNVKEKKVDFKRMYENYKKITQLSSMKKQMNNSKCVQIYQRKHTVIFTPTKNGGTKGDNRGYNELSHKNIIVENNTENLYQHLFQCLENCE